MLTKSFSAKKLATRLAFLLPILAFCIYFFNQDIVAKPIVQKQKQKAEIDSPYVYNSQGNSLENFVIKQKDLNRYAPNLKTQVLPKNIPAINQLEDWKSSTKYGVWIDGKRIDNSILGNKKTSDFDHYSVSKLEKNAANYGKHFYQVDLMTPAYYEVNKVIKMPPTLEQIEEYLTLKIHISDEKITVNGKETSLEGFTKTINAVTSDWTKEDMMNYTIQLQSNNGVNSFMNKLMSEFHKTKLYKTNPSKELIPPPPAPQPKLENFHIEIDINNDIYVNNDKVSLQNLNRKLNSYNKELNKEERGKYLTIKITLDPDVEMGVVTDVKGALYNYGVKEILVYPLNAFQKKPKIPSVSKPTGILEKNKKIENNSWGITIDSSVNSTTPPSPPIPTTRKISELKDFKITVKKIDDKVILRGKQGTAWKELTFTIDKNIAQPIDEWGMFNPNTENKALDPNLADLLITVARTDNGIKLQGIKGTVWTDLSFSLRDGQTRTIDQFGN